MTRELNKIKADFTERIENAEALLQAWKNVERVTKKDGGEFSALAKNFKGVSVSPCDSYSLINHKIIRVDARTTSGHYVSDTINNYAIARYSKREVAESRIIKESCLEKYFYLTIDEIFEDINARIELYEREIETYKKELADIEHNYNLIVGKLEEIKDILDTIAPKNGDNISTRYKLQNVVKNYNFY